MRKSVFVFTFYALIINSCGFPIISEKSTTPKVTTAPEVSKPSIKVEPEEFDIEGNFPSNNELTIDSIPADKTIVEVTKQRQEEILKKVQIGLSERYQLDWSKIKVKEFEAAGIESCQNLNRVGYFKGFLSSVKGFYEGASTNDNSAENKNTRIEASGFVIGALIATFCPQNTEPTLNIINLNNNILELETSTW